MIGDGGDDPPPLVANIAPELSDRHLVTSFISIASAPSSEGIPVSNLTVGAVDPDASAPVGIAIEQVNHSLGTVQFSLDDGATWNNVSGVDTHFLLTLAPDARLRVDTQSGDSAALAGLLTFAAWDQAAGVSGQIVARQTLVDASAISTATDQLDVITAATASPS